MLRQERGSARPSEVHPLAVAPVLRPNLVQDHRQPDSRLGDLLVDGGRDGVHVLLRHLLMEFQHSRGDMVVIAQDFTATGFSTGIATGSLA